MLCGIAIAIWQRFGGLSENTKSESFCLEYENTCSLNLCKKLNDTETMLLGTEMRLSYKWYHLEITEIGRCEYHTSVVLSSFQLMGDVLL